MQLSIVIPAYNAERTLARTVQMVLAQTFGDFELLIVNNGSSDGTGEVAKRLARADSRIRSFDVYPNIWGYGARLYGWKRARGRYIASVDADDFISPEMYGTLLSLAARYDLDVVECGYDEVDPASRPGRLPSNDPGSQIGQFPSPVLFLSRREVIDRVVVPTFVDVGRSAYVWNKIYRNRYDFATWEDGVFGSYEDLIHNLQLFRPVNRYGYVATPFYHYAPNPSSVTRNFSEDRIGQFAATVAAKRKLVAAYDVADVGGVLDRWIVNDAKNGVISAMTAGRLPVAERARLVRRLLDLDEVKAALARQPRCGLSAGMLRALGSLPPGPVIATLQFVLALRLGVRRS